MPALTAPALKPCKPPHGLSGFSLLEVLVSIIVLSLGVLLVAALQFSALRGNNQSVERSLAVALAYEIADLMRTHRQAAAAGDFVLAANATPAAGRDCIANTCTQTQIAGFELDRWHQRLRQALPRATARIVCAGGNCATAPMHTVSIMWDENRTGGSGTDCPAGVPPDTQLACVQISFTP